MVRTQHGERRVLVGIINAGEQVDGFRTPAVVSLEREYHRVLFCEEAVKLGRSAARLTAGGGWDEPRASAVLVDGVARWLGRDAVTAHAFYANGGPAVEVYALIGDHYLAFDRFRNAEDMMAWCCERFKARFSMSKFAELDRTNPGPRVVWDGSQSDRIATRIAEMLTEAIDQDVARLVIGV